MIATTRMGLSSRTVAGRPVPDWVMRSCRLFLCARCSRPVRICRSCDRGQCYCSNRRCALLARLFARRRYRADHQATRSGRRRHAARQVGYRLRVELTKLGMQVVTDHPSTSAPASLIVGLDATRFETAEHDDSDTRVGDTTKDRGPCDFCGQTCGPFMHVWSYW